MEWIQQTSLLYCIATNPIPILLAMSPTPAEKFSIEQVETASNQDFLKADNVVEYERSQLLASLPDPDHAATEEQKNAIDKKLMWKVDLALVPWLSFL